jgi:uncharacterized membrane protein
MNFPTKQKITATAKRLLFPLSIAGITCSLALTLPSARENIIAFLETRIFRHAVDDPFFWSQKLLGFALAGLLFFAALLVVSSRRFVEFSLSEKQTKIATNAILSTLVLLFFSTAALLSIYTGATTWMDEVVTMATIRHPWSELVSIQQADVHPPLYFFYAKLWATIFGDTFLSLRIASVFPVTATLAIVVLFLKENVSAKAAIAFAFCYSAPCAALLYAKEIRMYGLALLFVTLTALAAYKVARTIPSVAGRSNCFSAPHAAFLLFSLCAAYTHYYAAVLVGILFAALFLFALCNNRLSAKPLLFVAAAAIVFYLPWLPTVLHVTANVSNDFWIKPMTAQRAIEIFTFPFESADKISTALLLLIYVASLVKCCAFYFGCKKNIPPNMTHSISDTTSVSPEKIAVSAFVCVAFFVVAGVGHDFFAQPMFVKRYLLPGFALLCLVPAVGLSRLRDRRVFVLALALLSGAGVLSGIKVFRDARDDNAHFARFYEPLKQQMSPDDVFVISGNLARMVHWRCLTCYFFPNQTHILEGEKGFGTIGGPTDETASRRLFTPRFVKLGETTLPLRQSAAWVILETGSTRQRELLARLGDKAELRGTFRAFSLYRVFPAVDAF